LNPNCGERLANRCLGLLSSVRSFERFLIRIKGGLLLFEGRPNAAGAAEDHFWQAVNRARANRLVLELRAATSLARLRRNPSAKGAGA
jgi:hypothetical protein